MIDGGKKADKTPAPVRALFENLEGVLHVFQKKTQKTSELDLAVARRRLALVRRTREEM